MSNNESQLRDETGALIGGLDVLEYNKGFDDFNTGSPPPEMTTASYDLGRQRGAERKASEAAFKAWMDAEDARRMKVMQKILPPADYAELVLKIEEIRRSAGQQVRQGD